MLVILPPEVIDGIMDTACCSLDARSVSSIALTSHSCHSRANKSRFSALAISNKADQPRVQHTTHTLNSLAYILRRGRSIPTLPNICAFVTSFSLRVVGFSDEVDHLLDDGSLAYIFENLLRPSALHNQQEPAIRSFQMSIFRKEVQHSVVQVHNPGLQWAKIHPVLSKALGNLLKFSEIDHVSLQHMYEVPPDVLRVEQLKWLHLQSVIFRPGATNTANNLELFDFSGPEELIFTMGPNTLPRLTELRTNNTTFHVIKAVNSILQSAPLLRSFHVGRSKWQTNIIYPNDVEKKMEYSHLEHMQKISFTSCNLSQLREITRVVHCDKTLPPCLTELEIVFRLTSRLPSAHSVIRDLEDFDIGMIDKFLINPSFNQFTRITLRIDLSLEKTNFPRTLMPAIGDYHLKFWQAYLATKVPLLREKDAERLRYDIRIVD